MNKSNKKYPQDFISKNWGTGLINLSGIDCIGKMELTPIELHMKEDGSKDNTPSFCFVMKSLNNMVFYGQFSEATLKKHFAELGYELKRIKHEP